MSQSERLLANPTQAYGVHQTQVHVQEFGKSVKVRDTYHSWANHFIKQSRKYFPRTKLHLYINCYSFLKIAFHNWLCTFLGALSILSKEPGQQSYKWAPVGCFFVVAVWVAIFCQHETISRKTMVSYVLKQPVLPGQKMLNTFYRVTIRELDGVALTNYQTGLGYLSVSAGHVEFQAFNQKAVVLMKKAIFYSRLFLFLFLLSAAYNLYFMFAYTLGVAK